MASSLTVFTSMATRHVLASLAVSYRERTGRTVRIVSLGGIEIARRLREGEATDVVILAAKAIEDLEAEGHLVSGSRADFARSGIAVAVRAGAPRPDIDNAEAVRNAILGASRVCFSTGPSGDYIKQLWSEWGIAESMAPRAMQAPAGTPVAAILARGDADLGLQQLSELLDMPGIDIVGPLPADIQSMTVFSAAISRRSDQTDVAGELIAFLVSPMADEAKRSGGMEPA